MITLDAVYKWYHRGKTALPPVLGELSFTVGEGGFICVLGPSGCGKTTLLNLVAGFIAPSQGQIFFRGKEIHGPGPDRGVVFQEATLFPWRTVWQNVAFGLEICGEKGQILQKTVRQHLELMGLTDHADKYPHTLSGGMRQKVAIARVLALDPQLLLMDEPFSALDANSRERLQDEVLRLWHNQRRTVLYVTHSVEEAAYLADRILILSDTATGLYADIDVGLERPRDRSHPAFLLLKNRLRRCLASQPCCIQPSIHR